MKKLFPKKKELIDVLVFRRTMIIVCRHLTLWVDCQLDEISVGCSKCAKIFQFRIRTEESSNEETL